MPRGGRAPARTTRSTRTTRTARPARAAPAREPAADAAGARPAGQGQSIAAVERALDVLLLFGRGRERDLGVTEIAGRLGLSKAAVHRILTTLRSRDLVVLDESSRRYLLGPAALGLGRAYLDRLDVRALAAPELAWLSRHSDETATLSVRNGATRMYVDQVVPDREVRLEVALGVAYPLHAGGSSKAFLAFLSDEDIEGYLSRTRLDALTDRTITDEKRLRRELARIRRQGYATSLGERQPGAASVAAPVLDHDGLPVAVVGVSGPLERFRPGVATFAELLLQATARLSARMGHTGAG